MRWLLTLLREHEGPIEADLLRFYGVDYLDRWRTDEDGRPRLTLRRILNLIKALPVEAALVRAIRPDDTWTRTDHLLDDLRMRLDILRGEKKAIPHPDRPKPPKPEISPERRMRLADGRRRIHERNRQRELQASEGGD